MHSLRELIEKMSLAAEENEDGAIVLKRDGELKAYSKEEAAAIRNKWLKEEFEEDN